MAFDPSAHPLDDLDWAILDQLQADGRLPFSELGRRVALSAPAVTERVRRLEAAGIISGYRAVVSPAAVGLPIESVVRVRDDSAKVEQAFVDMPEVLEAMHVTGEDCWVVRVVVPDMATLEQVVRRFGTYGPTTTSLVFSAPIRDRPVVRPAAPGR
ncbi:MAG TPA: Lrp/AsnC family transcriptional regulator [Aquihabitans sp.]|jgi:Lrp/AsnC family leucine-responsive transcriptional regulator|nr:Lrp/AsnC family transcriptional regulator [Aquihabitans sp.]